MSAAPSLPASDSHREFCRAQPGWLGGRQLLYFGVTHFDRLLRLRAESGDGL